ncbi:MAG: WD40/YVTN/BNR-like repeat-containing protein [Anaerolineales bacterium]
MRWKLALTLLLSATLACTAVGTPLSQPEAAPASGAEPVSTTEVPPTDLATETPFDTPAPYADDTPLPPTIAAPLAPSPDITFLHMLNELDGWAISENAILRTTDGSSTWYNLSPQGVTGFGYGTPHTFLSASQAWVMVTDASDPSGSGQLYRTEDGGLNWMVSPVPFGSGDMTFIDENTGWMMASLGVAAGSMGVSIYRTEDAGATWTQAYTNDPTLENAGNSLPLGGLKGFLTPLDADTAWVGGVVYAPETFYLFKSGDGGQTWVRQTPPAAPGMQNTEVSIDNGPIFTTPTDGILPVRFTGETNRTAFYATHDSGLSWEFLTFMPGAGSLDFVSPSDGFFWTGEQFFVTGDGAQTWTTVNSDTHFGESFAGMDFVNTRTGWVWTYDQSGKYGLYKTTDGGTTWFSMEN